MKPFGIILSVIALLGVSYYVFSSRSSQRNTAVVPVDTQAPTNTPRPVTPTLDYLATAQSERLSAVNAAEVSRRNELDAQQAAIYAQQTADGAQIAALQLTATLGAQEIERSAISATAGSVAATKQAAGITDWNNRMSATAQAPSLMLTAARAESAAQMAKYDGPVRAVSSVLFGMTGVGLVIVMGFAIRGRQPAEIITEMAPLPVAHIHTSPSEAERVEPPPCTEQQWHAWSWQMLNGGSAAVGEWETSGSPFVGTEYRLGVYRWAVKHKMIGIDGPSKRQVLNDKGMTFCREYLGATSPAEGFA